MQQYIPYYYCFISFCVNFQGKRVKEPQFTIINGMLWKIVRHNLHAPMQPCNLYAARLEFIKKPCRSWWVGAQSLNKKHDHTKRGLLLVYLLSPNRDQLAYRCRYAVILST